VKLNLLVRRCHEICAFPFANLRDVLSGTVPRLQ
jgi:hypothetical protein